MLPPKWFVHISIALGAIGFMLMFLAGNDWAIIPSCVIILAQVWLVFPQKRDTMEYRIFPMPGERNAVVDDGTIDLDPMNDAATIAKLRHLGYLRMDQEYHIYSHDNQRLYVDDENEQEILRLERA